MNGICYLLDPDLVNPGKLLPALTNLKRLVNRKSYYVEFSMGAMGFSASYSKVGWYTYILYCVTVEHILTPSNFMFPWNSILGPLALCANLYQTGYHVGWQDTLCYSKTTDKYRQMLKYNTIFITLISQIICISFFIVLSNTNHTIGTKTTKKKNKHTKHSHLFRRNKNLFFSFLFLKQKSYISL